MSNDPMLMIPDHDELTKKKLAERYLSAYEEIASLGYPTERLRKIRGDIVFDNRGIPTVESLLKNMEPKDILQLRETLINKYERPMFYADPEKEVPPFDLYDDKVDLSEMNRWLKAYMERVDKQAPKQSVFVIEEASELATELMSLIKVLTKVERKISQSSIASFVKIHENEQAIFEEACDVVAAILMMFVRDGYHLNDVLPYITSKYKRAVERFDENNAV